MHVTIATLFVWLICFLPSSNRAETINQIAGNVSFLNKIKTPETFPTTAMTIMWTQCLNKSAPPKNNTHITWFDIFFIGHRHPTWQDFEVNSSGSSNQGSRSY